MRVIFGLTVLVAFCAIQSVSGAGVLDTLIAGITRQKNQVKSTINRLERHKRNFSFDLSNKLSNLKLNSMQQINSIVNPTLKSIEDAANESTANGKDASKCYEEARASLREYSLNGFDDLENCRSKALESMNPTFDNIDSTLAVGQQVLTYYDSIVPSCYTSNVIQMQSCITNKLPAGVQLVKSFETTADNIINTSNSVINTATISSTSCNNSQVNKVRDGASSVKIEANQCIASL